MRWEFNSNHIEIEGGKPRSTKKLTMTRLGAILGVNPWQSPFAAWCEITKVYTKPFVESRETLAGKVIEPIVRDYIRDDVYCSDNVVSPEEYYGNSWGVVAKRFDFYPEQKVFGGMWDTSLTRADKKTIKRIFEQKTTKRVEDWAINPPMYYLVQGLGYGYMSGVRDITMVASFLEEDDYNHPELFKPTKDNTAFWDYKTNEANILLPDGNYYTIEQCFMIAQDWWNKYVATGISPEFDETKACDKEILKELGKVKAVSINGLDNSIDDYLEKVQKLEQLKEVNGINDLEKELKSMKEDIVEELKKQMKDEDTGIEYGKVSVSKSKRTSVDTDALKKDGLYDTYSKVSYTYSLKINK